MGRRRASETLDAAAKRRLLRLIESGATMSVAASRFGVSVKWAEELYQEYCNANEVASVKSEALQVRREDQ